MNSKILQLGMEDIGATLLHVGKVRDVYQLSNGKLAMVASNRISAFDVILPQQIPYKGEILTRISWKMLNATREGVPNWAEAMPDPQVTVGVRCAPIKVEMVVRNFLTGSWWRKYKNGERIIGGHKLRDGMEEFDRFNEAGPIWTPTTKAEQGHDEDISFKEIVKQGLCTERQLNQMCVYALGLFKDGARMASKRGLVLCDTKYEFGLTTDGQILLIDEVNTPDSSRYFYAEGFNKLIAEGKSPRQLSKEFVRQWLIEQGFQGRSGDTLPALTDEWARGVTDRYVELYENIMGEKFIPTPVPATIGVEARIVAVLQSFR